MLDKKLLYRFYYHEGKSLKDIAVYMDCSLHQVQYWMAKYGFKTRNRSQALYLKHNPDGDPFNVKSIFTKAELVLLGLGLGLWWGEGSKKHHGTIRLGNSDPRLIKKFCEFLQVIFGVKKEKIRFGLQVFSDMHPEKAREYWIGYLGVNGSQFHPKVVITKARGEGSYREKTKYGVLTLHCANIKLREAFDKMMSKYTEVGL